MDCERCLEINTEPTFTILNGVIDCYVCSPCLRDWTEKTLTGDLRSLIEAKNKITNSVHALGVAFTSQGGLIVEHVQRKINELEAKDNLNNVKIFEAGIAWLKKV